MCALASLDKKEQVIIIFYRIYEYKLYINYLYLSNWNKTRVAKRSASRSLLALTVCSLLENIARLRYGRSAAYGSEYDQQVLGANRGRRIVGVIDAVGH